MCWHHSGEGLVHGQVGNATGLSVVEERTRSLKPPGCWNAAVAVRHCPAPHGYGLWARTGRRLQAAAQPEPLR